MFAAKLNSIPGVATVIAVRGPRRLSGGHRSRSSSEKWSCWPLSDVLRTGALRRERAHSRQSPHRYNGTRPNR